MMPGNNGNRTNPAGGDLVIDPYRSIVFPNGIRRTRRDLGFPKLLAMAERLPEIPYVRLSKIERGEVFAKPEEMNAIAAILDVAPTSLLLDVDAADFDIGPWAAALQDWEPTDPAQDRFAVLLGAAVRRLRAQDDGLTIAAIELRFRIAPVILSRIENAFKPLERWNGPTVAALCQMFEVRDARALRRTVTAMERQGVLQPYVRMIADPEVRMAKTHSRIAALREMLRNEGKPSARTRDEARTASPLVPATLPVPVPAESAQADKAVATRAVPGDASGASATDQVMVRLLPVFGVPMADGLIACVPVGEWVEAPRAAGVNAYGLRVCRPTLGLGLPASAIVVVDPGRFPSGGGIAVVEEANGLRLLAVTFDRQGRMMGYSESPSHEVAIDSVDPSRVAMVISAVM